jgi:CHAT domain-containing protein/tetratricopeptide (TPR) repeat protein
MSWKRVMPLGMLSVALLYPVEQAVPPIAGVPTLGDLSASGLALYSQGQYSKARKTFEECERLSLSRREMKRAARFLNMMGACDVGVLDYRRAMKTFLEAHSRAAELKDYETLGAVASNIASVYGQFGDVEAAAQAAEEAARVLPAQSPHRAMVMVNRGLLAMQRDDSAAAARLLHEAIEAAWNAWDLSSLAYAWNTLGLLRLREGDLVAAEAALDESHRLRFLHKLDSLDSTLYNLGRLRLAQNRSAEAARLLTTALEVHERRPSNLPEWQIQLECGRAWQQCGDSRHALESFRSAERLSGHWRMEALGSGWGLALTETRSAEIAEAMAALSSEGPGERDAAQAAEVFLAIESSRADRLRAQVLRAASLAERLPPEYGEMLARLRALPDSKAEEAKAARARLAEMEIHSGLALPGGEEQLEIGAGTADLRRLLTPRDALLCFSIGEQRSTLWVLTDRGFEWHYLPGRAALVGMTGSFRQKLLAEDTGGERAGARLARALFRQLSAPVRARSRWYLSLDGILFQVPFAALPDGSDYLVEKHTLEVVPSGYWLKSREALPPAVRMLGFGDPIYNTADPRGTNAAPASGCSAGDFWRKLLPSPPAEVAAGALLPRLVGGGAEVRQAAQEWAARGFTAETLLGAEATRAGFERGLGRSPTVIHIAAHVLPAPSASGESVVLWNSERGARFRTYRRPGELFQALALGRDGKPDTLSTLEISAMRLKAPVVILSGCHTGGGETLPGAGILGLCRAWMAAGARTVVATHWPVIDDSGALLTAFHRELAAGAGAGGTDSPGALQQAQIAMLRSKNWRSQPRYWAAYFDLGRE